MKETIDKTAAALLAGVFVIHNPGEKFGEFTFPGSRVGLPENKYIVIKIFVREWQDSTRKTDPLIATVTPEPVYK